MGPPLPLGEAGSRAGVSPTRGWCGRRSVAPVLTPLSRLDDLASLGDSHSRTEPKAHRCNVTQQTTVDPHSVLNLSHGSSTDLEAAFHPEPLTSTRVACGRSGALDRMPGFCAALCCAFHGLPWGFPFALAWSLSLTGVQFQRVQGSSACGVQWFSPVTTVTCLVGVALTKDLHGVTTHRCGTTVACTGCTCHLFCKFVVGVID